MMTLNFREELSVDRMFLYGDAVFHFLDTSSLRLFPQQRF